MKLKIAIIVLFGLSLSVSTFSQKVDLLEGSLKAITVEKSVNVQFSYDTSVVRQFKDKPFLQETQKETYEKNFEILLNKYGMIECTKSESPYTLDVCIVKLNPGSYTLMKGGKKSQVSYVVKLYATNNKSTILSVIQLLDVPGTQSGVSFGGGGYSFNLEASMRITESYSKAGKMLGSYISKIRGK